MGGRGLGPSHGRIGEGGAGRGGGGAGGLHRGELGGQRAARVGAGGVGAQREGGVAPGQDVGPGRGEAVAAQARDLGEVVDEPDGEVGGGDEGQARHLGGGGELEGPAEAGGRQRGEGLGLDDLALVLRPHLDTGDGARGPAQGPKEQEVQARQPGRRGARGTGEVLGVGVEGGLGSRRSAAGHAPRLQGVGGLLGDLAQGPRQRRPADGLEVGAPAVAGEGVDEGRQGRVVEGPQELGVGGRGGAGDVSARGLGHIGGAHGRLPPSSSSGGGPRSAERSRVAPPSSSRTTRGRSGASSASVIRAMSWSRRPAP